MSEQEQFLNTIAEVLKPIESTIGPQSGISMQAMRNKLSNFTEVLEAKRTKVNEMANGYINTRNPSAEQVEDIKEQVNILFNNYMKSFNN
ncbi:hypothetical protein DVK85_06875 [Flavobacterium arcticum]|uniref:Uncharacterized protein n=1 Tax=Flavobacterium arcticum TaxID=1784713 RepID=A0A345HBM1_9FLAO|nr:hypothetical protein [Flavobacterium arcticum]AXG73981.1 hypothetical protein DVK85_06875 [Flavobacterium arcticum]KAF2508959.1 hypothetical protein E0W72_10360 [Flavobacterium arcticum]